MAKGPLPDRLEHAILETLFRIPAEATYQGSWGNWRQCIAPLFGYKNGTFTSAFRDKEGLLQAAQGGTVFLDEVSEMSLRMQSRLLRFLQEHTVMPVGAASSAAVDVRVVGASNQDLHQFVLAGKFREDLYYRMNVVEIHLAPLRDRPEAVRLLIGHFIGKHSGARRRPLRFSREAYHCPEWYAWPGNVRELEGLPAWLRPVRPAGTEDDRPDWNQADYSSGPQASVSGFEEEFLRYHLARSQGNISKTAASIDPSRVAPPKKIKQYGILV